MKQIFSVFIICLMFCTASCAKQTTVRHRNDYAKTLKTSRSITVLPVKAEVNMVGVGGGKERMYDYEYAIEESIFKAVKPMLKHKGYKVVLLNKRQIKDKNLFSNYELLYEDLGTETSSLYAQSLMEEEKAHNIENKVGKHALVIGKETNSDVLFLVNYLNNVQTNGARALGFMMDMVVRTKTMENADQAVILLSMIDAKTSNVLWCNNFVVSSHLFSDMFSGKDTDTKRVDQLLQGALKTLPNKSQLLDKISEADVK
jgi:hypothetical protein